MPMPVDGSRVSVSGGVQRNASGERTQQPTIGWNYLRGSARIGIALVAVLAGADIPTNFDPSVGRLIVRQKYSQHYVTAITYSLCVPQYKPSTSPEEQFRPKCSDS